MMDDGQSPQVVEDQVTFPLTSALLSVPHAKAVRGASFFGTSFVYVIFDQGTDIYWARSRVLEYLNGVASKLPDGVTAKLGPDATGVGWVYQYALTGQKQDLSQLRTLQDWHLRYALAKTEGVAEVAAVGGYVKQYAVIVDPNRMRSYGIALSTVRDAIAASNTDVGGRTIEMSETEFMVRGRGYLKSPHDLDTIVLKAANGTPVQLSDIAHVEIVPDERRGLSELNGQGEVASGIVVQRYGANTLAVIAAVKKRLAELARTLPDTVKLIPVYDRSVLIGRAIETLKSTLIEESLIVALVCFVFLMHAPKDTPRLKVLIAAATEVGPSRFFSLLIITVSFLPIFALEEQEGRMFHPLAFTKSFAMAAAAFLSVTLVPALMVLFVRGRIMPEARTDMLSTGIRTPVGVKVFGTSLAQVEAAVRQVPGTTSAYAERINGGYYLEIIPDREQIARYGLSIDAVLSTVASAVGAKTITTTVEGRERYGVVLRYPRDVRSDPAALASDTLISLPEGGAVSLGEVADIRRAKGPAMVRTEDGQLVNYVYVDFHGRDLAGYVHDAQKAVAANVRFPSGAYVRRSGQFEYLERARQTGHRHSGHAGHHFPAEAPEFQAAVRHADRHTGAVFPVQKEKWRKRNERAMTKRPLRHAGDSAPQRPRTTVSGGRKVDIGRQTVLIAS